MAKPSTRISPDKLKDKSHLLYKIQQKHGHWNVAKCALLIGAGCSYPTLPLGGGLIKFCQQLCYIRDVFPAHAAEIEKAFLKKPDAKFLDNTIVEKEKVKGTLKFSEYVKEKEVALFKIIELKKDVELKKIPDSFPTKNWDDFKESICNDAKYGYWLDAYSSSPRERQRFIEALIEGCTPSGAYIILALLIEKGYLNNILTTNFDDFINDTLLYYTSTRPRFYADDEISQYISIHSDKPNIIKLHGDFRYANIKNTNDETLKLTERMEDKLRELLINLDLIVIGYNGSDYSIMNVLKKVKTPNCELLWCSIDENNVHWRVADLINNTTNSWFIKIKGFDDLIKDFYLELVKSPPDLVAKATIRQEEIAKYIKEYNKELQDKAETPEEKESLQKQETKWELMNKAVSENDSLKRIELLTKAINSDKGYVSAYLQRGVAYFNIRNFIRASSDFETLLTLEITNDDIYSSLGACYVGLKQYDKALVVLDKAIQLNENNDKAYNNRGATYVGLQRYDDAIRDLTKSIQLDAKYPKPYKHLSKCYFEQGVLDMAMNEINKAIELDREYWEAYELRALIYDGMGKDKLANDDRKRATAIKKKLNIEE